MELPGVVPVVASPRRRIAVRPRGVRGHPAASRVSRAAPARRSRQAHRRDVSARRTTAPGSPRAIEDVVNGGDDTWARPTDVAVAPDGAVFVADWYDPGVGGHQMGDPNGGTRPHLSSRAGRQQAASAAAVDLTSTAGLDGGLRLAEPVDAAILAHTAIAAQGQARAAAAAGTVASERSASEGARALDARRPRRRRIGCGAGSAARSAIRSSACLDCASRSSTARTCSRSSSRCCDDSSPQVRREIALMLRDRDPALMLPPYVYKEQVQPPAEWLDAMAQLASQYDGKDRWYLEAHRHRRARTRGCSLRALKNDARRDRAQHSASSSGSFGPRPHCGDLIAVLNNPSASCRTAHDRARHTWGNGVARSGTRARGVHHEPVERAAARGARVRALQPSALQLVDGRSHEPGAAADRPEDVRRAWRPGRRGRHGGRPG